MIRFSAYRWIQVFLGARSFKIVNDKGTTHILVKGPSVKVVEVLKAQGYTEEWPRNIKEQ